nr:MAG TPA: hypothetical protein [Caudoviricetes sp.]
MPFRFILLTLIILSFHLCFVNHYFYDLLMFL